MKKKYMRAVFQTNDGMTIKEEWKETDEEGQRELAFLRNLSAALNGEQGFVKLTTRSGNIEVIPRDILLTSHAKIEYSRFGF